MAAIDRSTTLNPIRGERAYAATSNIANTNGINGGNPTARAASGPIGTTARAAISGRDRAAGNTVDTDARSALTGSPIGTAGTSSDSPTAISGSNAISHNVPTIPGADSVIDPNAR